MTVCKKCVVSGRVQGVYYRAATQQRAMALGLQGWARNLPDGRVEVVVSGPQAKVEELCAWLWQGPPRAEVSEVRCTSDSLTVPPGFEKY